MQLALCILLSNTLHIGQLAAPQQQMRKKHAQNVSFLISTRVIKSKRGDFDKIMIALHRMSPATKTQPPWMTRNFFYTEPVTTVFQCQLDIPLFVNTLLIFRHEIDMKFFELLEKHLQLGDRWKNRHSVQSTQSYSTAYRRTKRSIWSNIWTQNYWCLERLIQ